MFKHLLFAACFAFYLVEVVRWQRWLKVAVSVIVLAFACKWYAPKRVKPFDCVVCLSAWTGLATGLLDGYGWQSIQIMFIAGVAGLILDSFIKKYL